MVKEPEKKLISSESDLGCIPQCKHRELFLERTRALIQPDPGARLDIVDPDVSPGAVREGALNLQLREEK